MKKYLHLLFQAPSTKNSHEISRHKDLVIGSEQTMTVLYCNSFEYTQIFPYEKWAKCHCNVSAIADMAECKSD